MINKIYHIIMRISLMTLFISICSSCVDDELLGNMGEVDGSMRKLHVELTFDREDEQPLSTRTGEAAEPGNAIQNIKDLRILIYDAETEVLIHDLTIMSGGATRNDGIITNVQYSGNSDNRLPEEKNEGIQDSSSGKVTFNILLPSARYYIYAIANAPDITTAQVSNRHNMKNIPRRWIVGNIAQNSEMFGIFSAGPDRNATDAQPLAITNKMVSLHCWVRRLASKVTVAFDGSKLFDNVQVYIDSISLYDIPQQCLLGNPNKAGRDYSGDSPEDMLAHDATTRYRDNTNGLIFRGPVNVIQPLPANGAMLVPENYYHICNTAHPYLGKGDEGSDPIAIDNAHKPNAVSLFFYENLQGTGAPGCKKQDANDDKVIDNPKPQPDDPSSGWKDGKPYGTYIEVHGYYRCASKDNSMSEGPIKYRFMLGKDTDHDFNAERNTHYQLTLQLKGFGNDADWHIDYEHPRGLSAQSPQFISYLYNKKTMATIRLQGEFPSGYYLRADIMPDKETWRPWGNGTDYFPNPPTGFATSEPTSGDGPWNSFLSLRKTQVIKIESPDLIGAPSNKYTYDKALSTNKNYYSDEDKGVRIYRLDPSTNGWEGNGEGEDGTYFVTATRMNSAGTAPVERMLSIPLYTRAKELVTWTGFTGNNPYTLYARKMRVRFSLVTSNDPKAKYEDVRVKPGEPYYTEPVYLDVIQVPRIVNPKGVWRKGGKPSTFHVQLMQLNPKDQSNFYAFKSIGKWSAEVITASAPIVTLSSTHAGSGQNNIMQNNVSRIEGETELPIDFTINFNGQNGYAVVRVRYHNYSCEHDIFCCSGYDQPTDVANTGTYWSNFNVDYFDGDSVVMTKDPRQEGSMFKRGCHTAILAKNSKEPATAALVRPSSSQKYYVKYDNGTTDYIKWGDIKTSNTPNWEITNKNMHIATGDEFYELIASNANDINFHIKKAYGVLYGEGATETQSTTADAYGYHSETGEALPQGMRGVFVYSSMTYKQIFLPIGMSGHGHRKTGGGWRNNDTDGTMRYASRSDKVGYYSADNTMNQQRPLFYDLSDRPGAIYWMQDYHSKIPNVIGKDYEDNSKSSAFDINFFTMGFEGYGNNAVPSVTNTHACFIRTVMNKKKQ